MKTQVKKLIPLIPSQWYKILKLKKVEVIVQLTARSISHTITTHIMTLKSKLYQVIKQGVKTLTEQFNALIGDDWTVAFRQSGKTFKQFTRELLLKFHPDVNNGSEEATTISQTINGWEEPQVDSYVSFQSIEKREREIELQAKCAYSKLKTMQNLDEIEQYLCSLHWDVIKRMVLDGFRSNPDISEEVKSLFDNIWLLKVACGALGDSYDHAEFERRWAEHKRRQRWDAKKRAVR